MPNKSDYVALVFFTVILTLVSVQGVLSWSGNQNTIGPGFIETPAINATDYYLNDVNITGRLQGTWGTTGLTSNWMDLNGVNRSTWPTGGNGSRGAKFVVSDDGLGDYTTDGTSDQIQMNQAINALTPGRDYKERVLLRGDFTISAPIDVDSYTILELDGKVTLASSSNCNMVEVEDVIYVDITGGEYFGNKDYQTGDRVGLYFSNVNDSKVDNVYVHHIKGNQVGTGKGMQIINYCNRIKVTNTEASDCDKAGFMVEQGSKYISFDNCIARRNYVENIVLMGWGSGSSAVSHIEISNCLIENATAQDGIDLYKYSYHCSVTDNIVIQEVPGSESGISCGHSPDDYSNWNKIDGNMVYLGSVCPKGIVLKGESDFNQVNNNYIYFPKEDGIKVYDDGTDYNQITDNYIYHALNNGVRVDTGASFNHIDGTYAYNITLAGVYIGNAGCINNTVLNSHLLMCGGANPVNDSGTGTMVYNNVQDELGWVP